VWRCHLLWPLRADGITLFVPLRGSWPVSPCSDLRPHERRWVHARGTGWSCLQLATPLLGDTCLGCLGLLVLSSWWGLVGSAGGPSAAGLKTEFRDHARVLYGLCRTWDGHRRAQWALVAAGHSQQGAAPGEK
jgi:hypothetical protein